MVYFHSNHGKYKIGNGMVACGELIEQLDSLVE
jgi:hypothetical protein